MRREDGITGLAHNHGVEITRFVKPGHIVRVMKDGCLITELHFVQMADDTGHTAKGCGFADSSQVRERLLKDGYEEDF